jgi:ribosome-binding ATPase YchF (GTP1/OBG family)
LTEEIELVEEELDSKISKAEKARRKREKAREKERQREKEIEEETANAGPSQKNIGNRNINAKVGASWADDSGC